MTLAVIIAPAGLHESRAPSFCAPPAVSRIEQAQLLDTPCDRPTDFDLAAFWKSSSEQFERRQGYSTTLRLEPSAAAIVQAWCRVRSDRGDGRPVRHGWVELHVDFDDEADACFVVLGLGSRVKVVAPETLPRSDCRGSCRDVQAKSGGHMNLPMKRILAAGVLLGCGAATQARQSGAPQGIDLAQRLAAGKLRAVNREVTAIKDRAGAVHLSQKPGNGVVWIDATDFAEGTIELDIRGRDVLQQSFVGIAFHRKDDTTYEVVYLRPFNFRAADPTRHQHAVQYISLPEYDWPRLRKEFPEEFENPVDQSLAPTGWVPLRIVVKGGSLQIYVGPVTTPTLEVRKLGQLERGMVGLWAGNNSDGDYANLRITPGK
jgi:hypothetical protein